MANRAQLGHTLRRLIQLGEATLALPDDRATWTAPLEQIISIRRTLLTACVVDRSRTQAVVMEIGLHFLANPKQSPRQKIIMEYETSMLGVSLLQKITFIPSILLYWETPEHRPDLQTPGHTVCANPIRDMIEFERQRIRYSLSLYFDRFANLDQWIEVESSQFSRLEDSLRPFADGKERILEIGFLHQHLYRCLQRICPEIHYIGADCSLQAVEIARRQGINAVHCNAWFALPFVDEYFDGIVAANIEERDGLWLNREFYRVLAPDGEILLLDQYNSHSNVPLQIPIGTFCGSRS
jgi:hypothetical protein